MDEETRKAKKAEYARRYYAANKDRYNEYKRQERARKGEELLEKERQRYRDWYHNQGGKESTRRRKGYKSVEEYLAQMDVRRLKSLEAKRARNASEIGKRDRCARTIYRKFRDLGFTIDHYDELYDKQNGKCEICKEDRPKYGQLRMHIDHCHATGKVRGLLCPGCNSGLGGLKEDVNVLKSAIAYLEGHA